MTTTTFLTITAELGCQLAVLPGDAVKVFLAVAGRSMEDGEPGVSCQELADQCDLTPKGVRTALAILSGAHPKDYPDLPTLVKWGTKAGERALKVDPMWIGQQRKALRWFDDADSDRATQLDREVRRLNVELGRARTNESSDVGRLLKGESRDVAVELESRLGRALTAGESYYLGEMIAKFGPDRTRRELRAVAQGRDPLRYAYARMLNGTSGRSARERPADAAYRGVKIREI